MAAYLAPADYVDSDHPLIIAQARQLRAGVSAAAETETETETGAGGGGGPRGFLLCPRPAVSRRGL